MMAGLSERQRRFVELYMGECAGNATEAYMRAGYKPKDRRSAESCGERLLRNVEVIEAIGVRSSARPEVATREERQAWWTSVMRGELGDDADVYARLRASELLGKSQLDFKERVELEVVESPERAVRLALGLGDKDG
jgi:phage terminase small subunit